jgi:hypothetical protein
VAKAKARAAIVAACLRLLRRSLSLLATYPFAERHADKKPDVSLVGLLLLARAAIDTVARLDKDGNADADNNNSNNNNVGGDKGGGLRASATGSLLLSRSPRLARLVADTGAVALLYHSLLFTAVGAPSEATLAPPPPPRCAHFFARTVALDLLADLSATSPAAHRDLALLAGEIGCKLCD